MVKKIKQLIQKTRLGTGKEIYKMNTQYVPYSLSIKNPCSAG